jgi:hypothetical protein
MFDRVRSLGSGGKTKWLRLSPSSTCVVADALQHEAQLHGYRGTRDQKLTSLRSNWTEHHSYNEATYTGVPSQLRYAIADNNIMEYIRILLIICSDVAWSIAWAFNNKVVKHFVLRVAAVLILLIPIVPIKGLLVGACATADRLITVANVGVAIKRVGCEHRRDGSCSGAISVPQLFQPDRRSFL